jgi:hypothetical protein
MRGRDLSTHVFPGNITNRINIITMRTGNATVVYNDGRTGQTGTSGTGQPGGYGQVSGYSDPYGVERRTTNEPPVERSRNSAIGDRDI